MQNTGIIIAHPTSGDKFEALKAFMEALSIKFEVQPVDTPYNPEFVEMVLQGDKDRIEGKGRKMTIEEVNNIWK